MAYLDSRVNYNAVANPFQTKFTGAYAAQYPAYEINTPQSPAPSPYTLANEGYRRNTMVYAAINYRARAVAEAPLKVYQVGDDGREELEKHDLRRLITRPNKWVTEEQFWNITEITLLISGFCAWEIERNNAGDPIALWLMRSDWCQFYRGEGEPIRAIRYQPYGLPPVDVPIENVLLYQYFDPIFPGLKGLSPLAVALNVVQVDNLATAFLNDFFKRGAMPAGLLKSDQTLSNDEADRIRNRWRETHGGAMNWSEIAVLGSGAEYQATGGQFSSGFDFSKLDGRDEARMCMAIGVQPILIAAQVGLQASTYSNYESARQAFYEGYINPEWRYLSSEVREQLVPNYETNPDVVDSLTVEFDTANIKALQEDEDKLHTRAVAAFAANLLTRDEARAIVGADPVDNAAVFSSDTKPAPILPMPNDNAMGDEAETAEEDASETPQDEAQESEADKLAKQKERDQFKAFIRHGRKPQAFKFKHLSQIEIDELINPVPNLGTLIEVINAARQELKAAVNA